MTMDVIIKTSIEFEYWWKFNYFGSKEMSQKVSSID